MKIIGLLTLFLSVGIATANYEEDVVKINIACQLIKKKLATRQVPDAKDDSKVWHGNLEVIPQWLPNGDCKISCGTSSLTVTPQNGVARVLIDGKLYEFRAQTVSQFRPLLGPEPDCPS